MDWESENQCEPIINMEDPLPRSDMQEGFSRALGKGRVLPIRDVSQMVPRLK